MSVKGWKPAVGWVGTWYWNRYPGARCDSESHVYWYTFSPELMREWEWSERYPGQPEIMRYLNHVADRFDLKRDIVFNTRVTAAHYDETANRWRVRTENGDTFTAKFLITAVGCLSTANVPKFDGLERFTGDCTIPANGRMRASISPANALDDRHRLHRHSGRAGDRRIRPRT